MDIKEYVKLKKEELKKGIARLHRKPKLVIIQVNDDIGSNTYVKGKLNDGKEIGADICLTKLPITTSQNELLFTIDKYNKDNSIDGLIVQMPLPKHINEEIIKLSIDPSKDVDGFHPMSKFSPCTPKGIIDYLKHENITLQSKNAVVIGRSNIVGKPMQKLLLKENANVTQLHSKTTREDMEFYLSHADIIVVAVGKKYFLDHSFKLKPDAVLVDVGINRDETGLKGDVEPNLNVKLQTPVPGGVGLLTRLSLLINLMEAYKNKHN